MQGDPSSCGDPSPLCPHFGTHGSLWHKAGGNEHAAVELYCQETDPFYWPKMLSEVMSEIWPTSEIFVSTINGWSLRMDVRLVANDHLWTIKAAPSPNTVFIHATLDGGVSTQNLSSRGDAIGYFSMLRGKHAPKDGDYNAPPGWTNDFGYMPYATRLAMQDNWVTGKTPNQYQVVLHSRSLMVEFRQPGCPEGKVYALRPDKENRVLQRVEDFKQIDDWAKEKFRRVYQPDLLDSL